MLTTSEISMIQQYSKSDPQLAHLFQRLEEEQQFTLSKVSHEIRNPVTLINSFLQMMESKYPEVEDYDYWDNIIENMDFLKLLLDELSEYNNASRLHLEPLEFDVFVEQLLQSLKPTLRYLHVTLNYEKRGTDFPMSVDSTKMKEAVLNLIRNGYEAMDNSGTLTILLERKESVIELQIQDDGSGIPEEYMPTLFDTFITHKKGGTGLGLSITKQITESHGGTIAVSSKAGEGTIFTLTFPIA